MFVCCKRRGLVFFAFLMLGHVSNSAADADLSIFAFSNPSILVVNATTYLFVEVSNFGDGPALDVTITTTLPPGLTLVSAAATQGDCSASNPVTCNLGTINAGSLAVQATVSFEVSADFVATISNDFSATSASADQNNINNSASATVEVVSLADSADQSVAYSTMPDWAYQNNNTVFPVIVTNNGPATVVQSLLTFSIPALKLSDFISAMPTQGVCTTALTGCIGMACFVAMLQPLRVDCDLGGISSGGGVSIDVSVNAAGDVGSIFDVIATVQSNTTADAEAANNQSIVPIKIVATPDLRVGSGPGGCFIATAAYGSDMAEEVQILRGFRDQVLMKNVPGRNLVAFYYEHSPPLARYIEEHDTLRSIVRALLNFVVLFIQFPITLVAVFIVFIGVVYSWRKKRKTAVKTIV